MGLDLESHCLSFRVATGDDALDCNLTNRPRERHDLDAAPRPPCGVPRRRHPRSLPTCRRRRRGRRSRGDAPDGDHRAAHVAAARRRAQGLRWRGWLPGRAEEIVDRKLPGSPSARASRRGPTSPRFERAFRVTGHVARAPSGVGRGDDARRRSRPPPPRVGAGRAPSTRARGAGRARRRRSPRGRARTRAACPRIRAQRRTGHGPGEPQRSQSGSRKPYERAIGTRRRAPRPGARRRRSAPGSSTPSMPAQCRRASRYGSAKRSRRLPRSVSAEPMSYHSPGKLPGVDGRRGSGATPGAARAGRGCSPRPGTRRMSGSAWRG